MSEQKKTPLYTVLFGMFPNAMTAIAEHSLYGSEKHNPGQPVQWAFDKSTDHAGCLMRHLRDVGTIDTETGKSHTIAVLWRAAALLETELVRSGAKPGPAVTGFEAKLAEVRASKPVRWGVFMKGVTPPRRSHMYVAEYTSELRALRDLAANDDLDAYEVRRLP